MKPGDLFLIDQEQFKKSYLSFRDKWTATAGTAMAFPSATATETETETEMETATEMATATEMGTSTTVRSATTVTNRTTNRKIRLNYYGHSFKPLTNNKIVGIVMEIIPEDNRDLDVIKFYDQGVIRYCRRIILEAP